MNRKEALKLAIEEIRHSLAGLFRLARFMITPVTQLALIGVILGSFIIIGIPIMLGNLFSSQFVFLISLAFCVPIGFIVFFIFLRASEILALSKRGDC